MSDRDRQSQRLRIVELAAFLGMIAVGLVLLSTVGVVLALVFGAAVGASFGLAFRWVRAHKHLDVSGGLFGGRKARTDRDAR